MEAFVVRVMSIEKGGFPSAQKSYLKVQKQFTMPNGEGRGSQSRQNYS